MTTQNVKTKLTTKDVAYVAMYLALFYVLDFLSNSLPLFRMPNGGTLGLGTIALLLASYQLGWKLGLMTSLLSILLQFMTGQMYLLGFTQFLLDYFFAFGAYGLACLFPNYKYFYSGVLITNLIRFISSTISGGVFYGVDLWGSIVYQATYLIPTTIVGLILVPLLIKAMGPRFFKNVSHK